MNSPGRFSQRNRMNGSLRGTGSTENHPRWGGADGRGTEHPPPLSPAALVERFSLITPTTRRFQRLLPPPGRGRAVYGDRPGWPCTGSVSETIRRDTSPDTVSTENHPVGEGLTGRGMEHPPPLSPAALVERFSLITPTTRRFQRLLPPPWKGAGSDRRLARKAVHGERE